MDFTGKELTHGARLCLIWKILSDYHKNSHLTHGNEQVSNKEIRYQT
jgi:hypothetical protein